MRKQSAFMTLLTLTVLLSAPGCGKKDSQEEPPQTKPQEVAPIVAEERPDVSPVPEEPPVVEAETGSPEALPVVEAEADSPEGPTVTAMYLGEVLVSWNTGKKDEAVRKFVALAWDDPAVLRGIPALAMPEAQLASLPEAQSNTIVQHAEELAGTLGNLVKEVSAAGDDLAALGDTEAARAHFVALRQSGEVLKAPNHLLIMQVLGEAMATFAQEKLDGMP